MFFIMGITEGRNDLDSDQVMTCPFCGRYARYHFFVTYTVLTLFFIPVFKWNKRYFAETSCCGSVFELDSETGRQIERGERPKVLPPLLTQEGDRTDRHAGTKCCAVCGYQTDEDFQFCPKCGSRF